VLLTDILAFWGNEQDEVGLSARATSQIVFDPANDISEQAHHIIV
jgi:hypothetical protein